MGPPPTPITPGNQLVLRTPTHSPSPHRGMVIQIKSEPKDKTPFRVKLEPGLAPPVSTARVSPISSGGADVGTVSLTLATTINAVSRRRTPCDQSFR